MDRAIVLIFLIGGIILAAYLTYRINLYTFGEKMREKNREKSSKEKDKPE
ncbi:MAG: hypothetical protein HY578_00680 [Nitrospinae bacterium]|nr:hypothetical protein [Nitrospinota bacterium]